MAQAAGRPGAPAITLRNDIRVIAPGRGALPSTHAGRPLTGEPGALIEQIRELADCGVEHLVLEFLSEDGRALDEQMQVFAERVGPALA